jgi:hypothetical protein|tara:strand:+ start:418 stop:588 length:171 start_codon:yes stop_codon:yes gene_type:complete
MEKDWYKSKTLWMGVLQVVGGIAFGIADAMGTGMALTFSGVATIALRIITKTEIKF